MVALLDINVLVALAWTSHVHHDVASRWFDRNEHLGWATAPVTQSGFVRVSSNRNVLPEGRTPHEAILLLRRIVELPNHRFWSDEIALTGTEYLDPSLLVGHRQVTDAHLLALALRHEGRLATLDGGVRDIVPGRFDAREVVCVLSATG